MRALESVRSKGYKDCHANIFKIILSIKFATKQFFKSCSKSEEQELPGETRSQTMATEQKQPKGYAFNQG